MSPGRIVLNQSTQDNATKITSKFKKPRIQIGKKGAYGALVAAHVALVLGVAVFILSSARPADLESDVFSTSREVETTAPIDEISSADVAVAVAQMVGLDETTAVMNHADSADALIDKPVDELVTTKPQIIATETILVEDVVEYVTVEGDTITSIAEEYGVTADSIKWSNDLPLGRLSVGKVIYIPPVDGIVYTVEAEDTIESLAEEFNTDEDRIISFNDAEIDGIVEGQRIVIPDGEIEALPAYTETAVGFRAVYGPANGYDWGWCTWHAANRRAETGKPIPRNLGNANTWAGRARAAGLTVSDTPVAGAVLWHDQAVAGYVAGGLGHVAYVEAVNEDGSILVSDMNSSGFANSDLSGGAAGGWSRVSYRKVTPDQFHRYDFIY